jgi:5-methylcytosine-specific restriction endonuclease McrA
MAKTFSTPLYNSTAWQNCRRLYIAKRIKIDGGLCEECHSRIGYIVHHKILIDESNVNDPNITLNHDNLEYVCKQCHDRFPEHFVKSKRHKVICEFDDFGQPYVPSS